MRLRVISTALLLFASILGVSYALPGVVACEDGRAWETRVTCELPVLLVLGTHSLRGVTGRAILFHRSIQLQLIMVQVPCLIHAS
jgi:hypothetical protein